MSLSSGIRRRWADVLEFWFSELKPTQWFTTSAELDETIRSRFLPILNSLASNPQLLTINNESLLSSDMESADDVLAAILVVDQFSRNIYRSSAKAFSTDNLALKLSAYLIDIDALQAMTPAQIQFAVMPHMHAESLAAQEKCVALFTQYQIDKGLQSAIEHHEIIRRFGRFPHRNSMLGRESSAVELAYLKDASTFGQ